MHIQTLNHENIQTMKFHHKKNQSIKWGHVFMKSGILHILEIGLTSITSQQVCVKLTLVFTKRLKPGYPVEYQYYQEVQPSAGAN